MHTANLHVYLECLRECVQEVLPVSRKATVMKDPHQLMTQKVGGLFP